MTGLICLAFPAATRNQAAGGCDAETVNPIVVARALVHAADLAQIGTVRNGAAYWVDRIVADDQIEVGAV